MARIVGTEGNDQLIGTVRADQLYGEGGDDRLYGDTGNDRISGGPGDDYLHGWGGSDTLIGGAGNDEIYGDTDPFSDADEGYTSDNADRIFGGSGDDWIYGGDRGPGDWISGGDGDDVISGDGDDYARVEGLSADQVYGDAGNDTIWDYSGVNRLSGGAGNDFVEGVGRLLGGSGDDWISAVDTSSMNGGTGADVFNFSQNIADGTAATITIDDFQPAEGDKIAAHVFAPWAPAASIYTPWAPSMDLGAGLFLAYDTNHDGMIRGDGSDAFSGVTSRGLELHNWEDTIVLTGVQEIAQADWITG